MSNATLESNIAKHTPIIPVWSEALDRAEEENESLSMVSSGPLFDICMAVNRAIRTPEGKTNFCVLAAAAARDILRAKGWKAEVLRVEAAVFPDDRTRYGAILGSDGDGRRRPAAAPGMWWGHLVAIAEDRWILDPTLDQSGLAPPVVIEFPDWWLAGKQTIFVPSTYGEIRYTAFPGRGGYKSAPDFRPCRRRGIVESVINELGAGGGPSAQDNRTGLI